MHKDLAKALLERLEVVRVIHERLELDIMETKAAGSDRDYYIACGKASMIEDEIDFLVGLRDS